MFPTKTQQMQAIKANHYTIYFKEEGYLFLNNYITQFKPSAIVILVDTNTQKDCLPILLQHLKTKIKIHTLCIMAGEIHKNITTCNSIWQQLTDLNIDRNALQINLGGGVITDLGGFVAATYKRGIDFINIPTTLLSMVDASVGGKTGVDLGNLKNLIGLFSNPKTVLIDTDYLPTVSKKEMRSGMAEIIKYGITYDRKLLNELIIDNSLKINKLENYIYRSITIKNEVVTKDPKEQNLRKILNFGHTIGHAIESHYLASKQLKTLTHGEAIAIGMIVELYISNKLLNFPKEKLNAIKVSIISLFGKVTLLKEDYPAIIELLKYDKKNVNGKAKFVLMNNLEDYELNCDVSDKLITDGFTFYSI